MWRDIATAPKDGTAILVYEAGVYCPSIRIARWQEGYEYKGKVDEGRWTDDEGYEQTPTVWELLPDPPENEP